LTEARRPRPRTARVESRFGPAVALATMAETIEVRDHSRPCEHGSRWSHWEEVRRGRWWKDPDCPGGASMVLSPIGDQTWAEVSDQPGSGE
jgi:hypothetical protein